jgi:predicted  nucleic acid-binding Zn-ribbon protein
MSAAVRTSVVILGLCVLISAGFAGLTYLQKQTLQGQNQGLHNQITEYQSKLADLTTKAKNLQDQSDQLNSKITQAQQEKTQQQTQYDDLKSKSDDLQKQLDQANTDRDDWKNRVQTVSRERDDLMQKLKNQPVKIVYKTRIVHAPVPSAASAFSLDTSSLPSAGKTALSQGDDQYWASVIRQKAALQVELQKEKRDLDESALQVVALKKQNSDLETEVKQLSNEKDEFVQKIKYGQDLADNLSIDLARSHNDQQSVGERADKVKDQNLQLLSQIRDLNSTKLELEKTVSRLTDEKDAMQRKLVETQGVIQSRIDDIWKIKASLDKKLAENAPSSSTPGSMELPPIIVNAPNNPPTASPAPGQAAAGGPQPSISSGKTEGQVISINESNNFVIVDLGQENSSVSVGMPLKVFRHGDPIATLQVIQVRRDICAADIKDKSIELKVGDVVRFG